MLEKHYSNDKIAFSKQWGPTIFKKVVDDNNRKLLMKYVPKLFEHGG
jgi:hypothetical protein